jgi:sterol desaturase/sphingolipid hydroxylase (fatty acid hydroxylase superfamily)
VVALDAALYGQHRVMHTFEPLWRLHRVHHTDPEFDVTTALRFHPLELPVTLALMCAAVLVAGPSVLAVALFSVIKVAMSLIEHANFSLPRRLDRALRRLLVTPDVHRVHHSVHYDEGNSNFGTIFSLWDRLCGSYCDRPRAAGAAMRFGVTGLDDGLREQTLRRLLSQPWLRVESQGHPQAGHLKAGALKAAAGHEPADDILARAEESR